MASASPAFAYPTKPPAFPDVSDAVTDFRLLIFVFLALPLIHSPINPPLIPLSSLVPTVKPAEIPETILSTVNVSIIWPTERSPSILRSFSPRRLIPPTFASVPLPKYPANPPALFTALAEFRFVTLVFLTSPPVPWPIAPPA